MTTTSAPIIKMRFERTTGGIKMSEAQGIVLSESTALVLHPVMNLSVARRRLAEFQEFVKDYLHEDEDFGTIPGTPKATLYKPGADKLCELYGLSDSYSILSKVEDWDRGLFDYTIECSLVHCQSGAVVACGVWSGGGHVT